MHSTCNARNEALLVGWLVDWLVGWLVDWLGDWLVDWLVDWLAHAHTQHSLIQLHAPASIPAMSNALYLQCQE